MLTRSRIEHQPARLRQRRGRRRRLRFVLSALAASIAALAFTAPAFAGLKHDFAVFYEWLPGTGANSKFHESSGTVTLQTVGGATIGCSHSTSAGEHTGLKTATATLALTGCQRSAGKVPCHSAARLPVD
jgi:hypothetical protein